MLKPILIFFFGLFVFQTARAQKLDTIVLYLKNTGQIVFTKDSADFSLVILPIDTAANKFLHPLFEYYPNGVHKLISAAKFDLHNINSLRLEGPCINYYPNGKKKNFVNYSNGIISGEETEYYPSGKLFDIKKNNPTGKIVLIECHDTTGKTLAENGNGKWLKYDNDFEKVIEEGPIKDSLEQGEWKEILNNNIIATNIYEKGILISRTDTTKIFSMAEIEPKYKDGGLRGFYEFLGHAIRYPIYAKEHNIQGKEVVTFVVERNGALTNVHIVKGAGGGLDEEAVRAVGLSPPWIPGMQSDKPVRVQYTVPISFTLSGDRY